MEDEAPPGVPEWVVTYGDMMSLLLTFFIMLVSMSEIVSTQKYRAVLEALNQRLGYRFAPLAPPGTNFPLNETFDRLEHLKLGSFTDDDDGYRGTMDAAVAGDDRKVFTGPEGTGRRVGPVFEPDAASGLSANDAGRAAVLAAQLVGEPNKIEVRSWVRPNDLTEPAASRSLRTAAYARAMAVQTALIDSGVDPLRLRSVILPAPPGSNMLSDALKRDGAVTVTVLDTFGSDFVGGSGSR